MFIFPRKVIKDLTSKFNRFLWNGEDANSVRAKVAWGEVCFPKKEGVLCLKCLDFWNKSFMIRHIWNLFAKSGSLWVALVRAYLLKGGASGI